MKKINLPRECKRLPSSIFFSFFFMKTYNVCSGYKWYCSCLAETVILSTSTFLFVPRNKKIITFFGGGETKPMFSLESCSTADCMPIRFLSYESARRLNYNQYKYIVWTMWHIIILVLFGNRDNVIQPDCLSICLSVCLSVLTSSFFN